GLPRFDWYPVRTPAAIRAFGQDDCQLALADDGSARLKIEGAVDANARCETAEFAFDDVKGLRRTRDRRRLLTGNQDDARTEHDANRLRSDPGHIHRDFHCFIRFKDVERGVTFARSRALLGSEGCSQLVEDCADVFS